MPAVVVRAREARGMVPSLLGTTGMERRPQGSGAGGGAGPQPILWGESTAIPASHRPLLGCKKLQQFSKAGLVCQSREM